MKIKNINWISNQTAKPFYARKYFELSKLPEKCILTVCGLGQFTCNINGIPVSNDVLKGAWTDFDKRIKYYEYDITNILKIGSNEFWAEIANGWYIGDDDNERHFYTINQGYHPYGKYLCFAAELDSELFNISTDTSWEVINSATLFANVYGSEDFDGEYFSNINNMKWQSAYILPESEEPKGRPEKIDYPPIVIKKIFDGKIIEKKDESVLFDFGQNMSGMFEVTVIGQKGSVIKVMPFEKLDTNGNPKATVNTFCKYTLSGNGTEVFCPQFSYAAGRWLKVSVISGNVKIISSRGKFISSSSEDIGTFHCSCETYNQIFNMIKSAVESNLNHCHTDCPTIEKLGWLEPNHLMGPSIMYMKNVDDLWNKISQDMRDAQYTKNEKDGNIFEGNVPTIAPRYARFNGSFWESISWGSSLILAPLYQYKFYGNINTIKDSFDAMKKYADHLTKVYQNYESMYGKKGRFICNGLGDWGIKQNCSESRENIETAYYYICLKTISDYAKLLNNEDDYIKYKKRANIVLEAYNEDLLKINPETGRWCYPAYDESSYFKVTQANQAIPLQFGMVPKDKQKDVESEFLLACEKGNNHFVCGEIGLPYVIRTLASLDRNDIVHNMIMQPQHPSYKRFVDCGETTLPEFWRDDARSRNHDMMGSIVEWFFSSVAGISSDDGFKTVKINPWKTNLIKEVDCTYNSINGKITVSRRGDSVNITVADNIQII